MPRPSTLARVATLVGLPVSEVSDAALACVALARAAQEPKP